ncbi:hypothetical protein ACGFZK_01625 [Streptomyces sp. NPDC048257]|uniref:hypothetical protein n=1 Tax=Streptomyces sp. NPDC048257 TaxID=3365526 RepID=UPI00371150DE
MEATSPHLHGRLARLRAGQGGGGDDDPPDGFDEQLGHPRLGAGEPAGGFEVTGLDGPEVAERADRRAGVIGASGRAVVSGMTAPYVRATARIAMASGSQTGGAALWTESVHRR